MHIHFLDPYRPGHSPVHRLDARLKLVLALAFILSAGLAPDGAWPAYALWLSLITSAEALSELGIAYVLKRAALALPFVLAALPLVFTLDGQPAFNLAIGPWELAISQPGLERFLSLAFKSWVSVQAAILLSATTSFPDLLVAMRALRIPRLLVAIFGLMWRYLFVLADEALRLVRARVARSGESGLPGIKSGGRLAWRARVAGGMAGSLFLRAFERSDRIYMAMVARGYDGEVRAFPLPGLTGGQWTMLTAWIGLLAALLALAHLLW